MKPLKIVPFDEVVGEVSAAVALAVVVVVVAKNRSKIRMRRFWPNWGLNVLTLGNSFP